MRTFRLIALTPPCLADPSIAIAASRAGAIGVLDLEYLRDERAALDAIQQLARYTKNGTGVKLDATAEEWVPHLVSSLPEPMAVVILTCGQREVLQQQVALIKRRNLSILLEVTSLDQAFLGEEIGVDGLIAKGHEAAGRVGEETTFILLQRVLAHVALPVLAQGGIGLHTVGACYAAGAAGVVLDMQLALTRESPLPEAVKASIARMDGSETACLGGELGEAYRVYVRPGLSGVEELRQAAETLAQDPRPQSEALAAWRQTVRERAAWNLSAQHVWLVGQDAAFAAPLARRFHTVGGVLQGIRQAIVTYPQTARRLRPLDEGAPLARSHGTRYPIVQGPMTRVSDVPAFAAQVAEGGALPFLALALLRATEVEALLDETRRLLGSRPWGVGILGFVPVDLRREQLDVIRAYRPPFALIAGGRPDQARVLEQEGIPTYLHVPSPGLLKLFLENGARRFVFEGRECGGHVGPRTSFVLWNTMIDVLLESLAAADLEDCHIIFAGGIHDALSASMVATMAAPLEEQGAKIGVLLGTGYLFTDEAVATGAIVKGFQEEAIRCMHTVLLETGPGHATRCVATPYAAVFERERQRLVAEGKAAEEIRTALEEMNLGRLRIASKGISRPSRDDQLPQTSKFRSISEAEQHIQGMYMIGQVAVLRDRPCPIADLHHEVAVKGTARLAELAQPDLDPSATDHADRPHCDVAIIGMACLLPKASTLQSYWENILNKIDAITEVPTDRWDWRRYFDPDPKVRDKIYSKWGGFLDAMPFDPTRYGMPPNTLPSIEPLQLLTLEVACAALQDAGYSDRPFLRERTSVIIGAGGGIADLGQQYALRSGLPMFIDNVSPEVLSRLPEWTEDSFAGILLNVAAGRVANRLDLGGVNYTVDAACASSLAAVHLAVRELEAGSSDMVLVGGADTIQNPFSYLCFSKTQALSPRGRCRTFDASADGIVISEGVAILVLKRLMDAEKDGDRIYAVIKAVAGSSDGRDKGLTAPRPEGQARALERAYSRAGFSPATVGLIEAHGTGTVAGDRAEVETLKRVFEAAGTAAHSCAIGSVKSMIGHTKCTAGVAGLVKVALSLHHKVLPPTIGVEQPNPILAGSPFYVNTEPRPWIHSATGHPRRAGVSAFGFGGTNFHTVVEEYTGNFMPSTLDDASQSWPSELFLWTGNSRQNLLEAIEPLERVLAHGAKPALHDLAYTLWQHTERGGSITLAAVATSLDDLQQKLIWAREALRKHGALQLYDPRGIYCSEEPLGHTGKVAFLFPGQGAQYPDMLSELTLRFPEVRARFEHADHVLADRFPRPLSTYVFPPPRFTAEEEHVCQQALTHTNVAQPALGAADLGLFLLLQTLGVKPDMVAGHSYGEYVALCAAGVFEEAVLYTLSEARGRFIVEAAGQELGSMAAVEAGRDAIVDVLHAVEGVWIANLNAPRQTIISGTRTGVEEASRHLEAQGIRVSPLAVACAFHSPVMAPARDRLASFLSTLTFAAPQVEVFSNATAAPYSQDPQAIAALLGEHLVTPVAFASEVEAMHDAGARIFVEVGPRNVLTGLTQRILDTQPAVAIALDAPGRSGLLQLHHALGQLAAHGVRVRLNRLYQGRRVRQLDLAALLEETRERSLPPTTWLVDGGRARPLQERPRAPGLVEAVVDENTPLPTPAAAPRPSAPALATTHPVVPAQPHTSLGNPTPPSPPDEVGRVMLQFQQLMQQFLTTQQQVMLTYLRGASDGTVVSPETLAVPSLPDISAFPRQSPPPFAASSSEPAAAKPESRLLETVTTPTSSESSRSAETLSYGELPPAPDREQLTTQLLHIVSERTGYPPETLDIDLNIEADLGIDSIKRVEILGTLQQTYLASDGERAQATMEELTKIQTLRGIIDCLSSTFQSHSSHSNGQEDPSAPQLHEVASAQATAEESDGDVEVPRFRLITVDAPLRDQRLQLPADALFLITDDEQGVAREIAAALRGLGGRGALVRMGDTVGEIGADLFTAELTDSDAVAGLLGLVRQRQGPIAGIIHLLPLRPGVPLEDMDLSGWRARLRLEVKSLFALAKAAGGDLKQAAESGRGWLVAATAMGGRFACGAAGDTSFFPGQGGIAGLVKTLAIEWPAVRCKAVDLDSASPIPDQVDALLHEMASGDGQIEVGYTGSRRRVLQPVSAPLEPSKPLRLTIDPSSVVLITGGARGITAEVACELAQRYQPKLLLAGRSPLPTAEEPPETASLTAPRELRTALLERLRRLGQPTTPSQVKVAVARLLHDREMRRTLATIQQAGARAQYYQVDVRDDAAMGALLNGIYRSYGRLDGVIHGAGIIEDKLLEDKDGDSFDRVFDTKVDSAFILSRHLRADSLQFLVLFSSVVGRLGNRGQSDYAAANEVLNKLAVYLDSRWAGRVVAIGWGPWAKTGMLSPEVQRQLAARGVQLIAAPAGRHALDQELRYGSKPEAEILIGGGPWGGGAAHGAAAPSRALPLLDALPLLAGHGGAVEVIYRFDPAADLYLQDHLLDAKPVVPAAMVMELMAEVVQKGWPEWEVVGVRSMRVLEGIILDDGPKSVRIVARPQTQPSQERLELAVDITITEMEPRGRACYRATVHLAGRLPGPPVFKWPAAADLHRFPMNVDEAYRSWLFHGPRLQCISEIEGMGEQGIVATVVPFSPHHCLAKTSAAQWLIDPIVIDSGPQLASLWIRAYRDMTALPSYFQHYHRFGSLSGSALRCYLQVLSSAAEHILRANVYFANVEGHLLGLLEGMECTYSPALNRLVGAQRLQTSDGL